MATLDLSAEGIGMLYLHCNEMQKEYVLAVEAMGKEYDAQLNEVNTIVHETNKYLEAFTWFYIKLIEENPDEYMRFFNSKFKKNIDNIYQSVNYKYEMYMDYVNRTVRSEK